MLRLIEAWRHETQFAANDASSAYATARWRQNARGGRRGGSKQAREGRQCGGNAKGSAGKMVSTAARGRKRMHEVKCSGCLNVMRGCWWAGGDVHSAAAVFPYKFSIIREERPAQYTCFAPLYCESYTIIIAARIANTSAHGSLLQTNLPPQPQRLLCARQLAAAAAALCCLLLAGFVTKRKKTLGVKCCPSTAQTDYF